VQHTPSSGTRPELAYGADKELAAKLDSSIRELALLNDDVQSLGDEARTALAELSQINQVGLDAAWNAGSNNANAIEARAASLNNSLGCQSWESAKPTDLAEVYSAEQIDRYSLACEAVASVAPLHDDWAGLVDGSKTVMTVIDDINAHDAAATDALMLATQGRYSDAVAQISQAGVPLGEAAAIASNMAKITDVSVLREWLSRTKAMDASLKLLWETMIASGGEITAQVTAALKNVNDAKALLPDNTEILSVVIHEMAGNLTQHGISIETAKFQLGAALDSLTGARVYSL
jgi:hypothetical protein